MSKFNESSTGGECRRGEGRVASRLYFFFFLYQGKVGGGPGVEGLKRERDYKDILRKVI